MKTITFSVMLSCITFFALSQSNFNYDAYQQFKTNAGNMSLQQANSNYPPDGPYYSDLSKGWSDYFYLDSLNTKYKLTENEKALLHRNNFMVSERLNYTNFIDAFSDIYIKDLPVFVSTDAILHALHCSYDDILMNLEISIMEPNLHQVLDALYNKVPEIKTKYNSNAQLLKSLEDIDLYVAVAKSLLDDETVYPHFASQSTYQNVMQKISDLKYVEIPLFTSSNRKLDFSQFTVRGHYTQTFWDPIQKKYRTLGAYFKTMMWLGRIDFLMSEAPGGLLVSDDIRRMNIDAYLMNELLNNTGKHSLLNQNDELIKFMIGESDNLTPNEYDDFLKLQNINSAEQLLDSVVYHSYYTKLNAVPEYGQKILSDVFIMDPFADKPDPLPVSFRLMGQRFIIDSYIFSNVVYDRIVYKGEKILRMMPDPLDAMFVLGNNDALPLLSSELEKYPYYQQLMSLRYLTESYDSIFWNNSLYNSWLQSLRDLNSVEVFSGLPLFMKTTAWQQEKLNTQLASWSELRHDNLLYAKQSYTGGSTCSYPHSYVEPYPSFYKQLADFSSKASNYFSSLGNSNINLSEIKAFFDVFASKMLKLESISRKELDNTPFSDDDKKFLQNMLIVNTSGMCGEPKVFGWYFDLYFHAKHANESYYTIADVHTQPTDEGGGIVGNVLHVGVGDINLGVFLANAPSEDFRPTAFVGPVMSYYQTITTNFKRTTDEEWTQVIQQKNAPQRPDWVNIYLADKSGNQLSSGRELMGAVFTGIQQQDLNSIELINIYPVPVKNTAIVSLSNKMEGQVEITNITGQIIYSAHVNINEQQFKIDLSGQPSGIYMINIKSGNQSITKKVVKE